MTWAVYQVVFKLKSPLHIGCGKVGNVQRTRPYVTGRVFWGALTMRLTRDLCERENRPATNSKDYYDPDPEGQGIGNKVNRYLAFTYFYPAIKSNGEYKIEWPWENESLFRRRFLSSYASTALVYPQQAAEEGLLHEVEFISPRTLDEGKQVYLIGYVFEKSGCVLKWKCACRRLQLGGERGYGWGDVEYVEVTKMQINKQLFNNSYSWEEQNGNIVIQILDNSDSRILAHTNTTDNLSVQGEIEPLVGREWRSHNKDKDNPVNHHVGQHVEYSGLCWTPGSVVKDYRNFVIKKFGIWQSLV